MLQLCARLTLSIFAVCALLTALAPLIAPRPVASAAVWEAFGFAACELPCWAGVHLGETSVMEGLQRITANMPALSGFDGVGDTVDVWGSQDQYLINASLYPLLDGKISGIEMLVTLPTDLLLTRLGQPDCIYVTSWQTFSLSWSTGQGAFQMSILGTLREFYTPHDAQVSISLRAGDRLTECATKRATPYAGIAPWWRYAERQTTP
jgi:hypothetical protein